MLTRGGELLAKMASDNDKKPRAKASRGGAALAGLAGGVAGGVGAMVPNTLAAIPALQALEKDKNALTAEQLSALRKHMGAENVPIRPVHTSQYASAGPHYDQMKKIVYADPSSYVVSHELGHSTSPFLGKDANKFVRGGAAALYGAAMLAPLIRGVQGAVKGYNEATGAEGGVGTRVLDAAGGVSQVGTGFQLLEEGQATARALNAIKKVQGRQGMLRAAKTLGPAYGTYAALALGAHGVAPHVGEWVGRKVADM